MTDKKIIMFQNRLAKLFRHLGKQSKRLGVSCYRLYDHDLPEFPFCIEFYGDKLYVAEYKRAHGLTEDEHDQWMEKSLGVISEIVSIEKKNIFLRLRQRKPGRLGQYQKRDETKHEFAVTENGLQFLVNLSDYLDTGLFLDHRVTRQMIREQSSGKKVLNLFGYTGAFSVYAAAGGADEVVTVDLSKTYLKWAGKNFHLNGFLTGPGSVPAYTFIQADVMQYMENLPAGYFDMVIMDPPTFSNSKRMENFLDIQRDHVQLINACLTVMKKGGVLFFSTNYRKFILGNEQLKESVISDITKATTPFDFEGKLERKCYRLIK